MEGATRYAKSGELNIAYQVLGDGPFDLLFAPGYMSHLEQNQWLPSYSEFLQRMASFSRLIVFDRRGTGLSDRILALGSYEEMLDDVRAVLDDVGSEQAALFGGAEGGPICALFAATFPERTSALILGVVLRPTGLGARLSLGPQRGVAPADPRVLRDTVGERELRPRAGSRPPAPTTSASGSGTRRPAASPARHPRRSPGFASRWRSTFARSWLRSASPRS